MNEAQGLDPEGLYYLNLFNLDNKVSEESLLDFYKSIPAEAVYWNRQNYFSADLEFKGYERFKKAVLLGGPVINS